MIALPCVAWQGPPEEWAQKLRGLDYWNTCVQRSLVHRQQGGHGLVQVLREPGARVKWCDEQVFFTYMPTVTAFINEIQETTGTLVVADVTADVLGLLEEPTLAMVAAHDEVATPESDIYWSDPVVLEPFVECLILADVITTSWSELVFPLSEYGHTIYLPDLHPGAPEGFNAGMQMVWRALGYPEDPWQVWE